jgi:hypothetical protein
MSDKKTRAEKIAADLNARFSAINPQSVTQIPRVFVQPKERTPEQEERLKKALKRLEDFKDL